MKVRDLMTADTATVAPDTPLKEVAALFVERDVSGVPVVDDAGRVLGVVSETDILYKERGEAAASDGLLAHLFHRGRHAVDAKLAARTAGEAMTAPAITVPPDASVDEAAVLLSDRRINRLPVVEDGRLVGIVTRADFVRAFARPDDEIAREIESLLEKSWVAPSEVSVEVVSGEARLEGEVYSRENAEMLLAAVRKIPGVVSVDVAIAWRTSRGAFRA